MAITDIYTDDEHDKSQHTLRYLSVKVHNVTGIMNRVISLIRRKRYNLEQVSVTFDNRGTAYLSLAINAVDHDINHVMEQIRKLYDVMDVNDITDHIEQVYHVVDVKIEKEDDMKDCPVEVEKFLKRKDQKYALFMVTIMDLSKLLIYLERKGLEYGERIIGLI